MTVRPIAVIATILGAALGAAACSEHLNGGAACPVLCPGQSSLPLDTTFRIDHLAPVYDTTVASFPLLGEEQSLLLANVPHRADVRGIMRFDSLTNYYTKSNDTSHKQFSPKVAHGALLWFVVSRLSVAATRGSDQINFLVYDVDTTADTTVSALKPLFTPSRLLGSSVGHLASNLRDTANAQTLDTIIVHLDTAAFLAKINGDRKLRLGILAEVGNNSTDGVRLQIVTNNTTPFIRYYGATDSLKDTSYERVQMAWRSVTPVTDSGLLQRLVHYPLIVQGSIPDSLDALNIGGIPSRRVFLHFALPPRIIDTANVIRATLILHPKPLPFQLPGDTVILYPFPVVSSNKVKTAAQATNFIEPNTLYSLDSVKAVPSSGAAVAVDFVNAVRNWQNVSDTINTRSLVLRLLPEGSTSLETSFWSSFAPDTSLRPHVRIQYVKRSSFGVP